MRGVSTITFTTPISLGPLSVSSHAAMDRAESQ